jgi:hypothetical protein
MVGAFIITLPARQQEGFSLKDLSPEFYAYSDAASCADCKGKENSFMPRAAGVDITGKHPVPDSRGWLSSVHARSQSHGDRIDTSCAWCHAPLTPGAVRGKEEAKPIPRGTWQGVSCGSCHPGAVDREKRVSLLVNFTPGSDRTDPDNYIFRSRADGKDMNAQCRYCHHESHDLLVESKKRMWEEGALRCVDCHMAAFSEANGRMERVHNFKVEENLPHSCSGGMGRAAACHEKAKADWFKDNLSRVKGPRKSWTFE